MDKGKIVIIISFIAFWALLSMSFVVSYDLPLSFNLSFLSIIALFLPYTMYKFFEFRRIKNCEKEFPNFLRDISEGQRVGLTIKQAIQAAAKAEYGALTSEIKRLEKQLSWNIPIDVALNTFAKRMSQSRLIERSVLVIIQANKSGGDVKTSIDKLASNVELIKEVRDEKATHINQHVMMMYGIFFIFLGITIVLIKFLVPVLQNQIVSGGSLITQGDFSSNPCYKCINSVDVSCINCKLFFGVSTAMAFGDLKDSASYYRSIFFTMILVQGFFSGIIAGQINSDSLIVGIKHSIIMLISGLFIFIGSVRFGFI